MEINVKTLIYLQNHTQCEWTRGFISYMLHNDGPTNYSTAHEIFMKAGENQKILGIKEIRAAFGLGLKEAKGVSDEYYLSGKIILPGFNNDDIFYKRD